MNLQLYLGILIFSLRQRKLVRRLRAKHQGVRELFHLNPWLRKMWNKERHCWVNRQSDNWVTHRGTYVH
jgi:hypothetical protein